MKKIEYFEITFNIDDFPEKLSEKYQGKKSAIQRYMTVADAWKGSGEVNNLRIWAYPPKGEKIDYTWELNKYLYHNKISGAVK